MKIDTDPGKIDRLLTRGVTEVIEKDHLKQALLSGKQLRVKLGFDPTGSQIHIGRAIVLRKLRDFQNLGHKVIFIVGDFTAQIGDPSDKLEKRPMLRAEQIKKNLETYKEQVGKIIDIRKADFVFNSRWLKKLKVAEFMQLQESFTVGQMLARRNFKERFESGKEISTREFSYPLFQGYDSVMVKADVELGGFDQLFNLQAGRAIQPHYGLPGQDILTTEMLEGTDGRKMSTSWGNVINISDEADDMFGKVMSVKDELIDKYFVLCTDLPEEEIKSLALNPRDKKIRLAFEIVKIYHGEGRAKKAQENFIDLFSKKNIPSKIPEIKIADQSLMLLDLVVATGFVQSKGEARRLIDQGGVKINEEKKTNTNEMIHIKDGITVQIGPRRFVKILKK
ncbi:MAG: tyrosine--tRNA ligase [Candidatus Harrisonbacteria bacterium]|nr:tyrosine--tRNA ligase [Candidatus Harrisonbacteria bacterium]